MSMISAAKKVICLLVISSIIFFILSSFYSYINAEESVEIKQAVKENAIKAGDTLTISVWGHDDLNQTVRVNTDGKISYPLIGEVEVAGLTVNELDEIITHLLDEGYIVNPHVTITMAPESRGLFFIYGEVMNPGSYSITEAIDALKAVIVAGGFTDFASHKVKIIRGNGEERKTMLVNVDELIKSGKGNEILMEPGDVIIVPRKFF